MSDKRKADVVILLKRLGKNKAGKVEFFKASQFKGERDKGRGVKVGQRYRLRVNGKWFPKGERKFFYKSQIRDLIWRSIKL